MDFLKGVIDHLSVLEICANEQIDKYLVVKNEVCLKTEKKTLLEISPKTLMLNEKDIKNKLRIKAVKSSKNTDLSRWKKFISEIKQSIAGLNHLGISYGCNDFAKEINFYKKILKGSGFSLYEEKSDSPDYRWFFVRDSSDWRAPLFEIVLNKGSENESIYWYPHFQIDLDTSLSPDNSKRLLSKHFGDDFVQWQLDISGYGTVLYMGRMGSINGVKICLGVGTDKRNFKHHRKYELKVVK